MTAYAVALWIPEDDSREHTLCVECWCQPEERAGIWWHHPEATVKKQEFKGWKIDG